MWVPYPPPQVILSYEFSVIPHVPAAIFPADFIMVHPIAFCMCVDKVWGGHNEMTRRISIVKAPMRKS